MKQYRLNHHAVLSMLPDRDPLSHKGNFGRILLICGSVGYTGAPSLAALGSLRSGAGLVYLAVPEEIYQIEAVKLLEPVILPLPSKNGKLSETAAEPLLDLIKGKDAVLFGPGLGQSTGVLTAAKLIFEQFHGPIVLDADGINVLAAHRDIMRDRTYPTIITPHAGEFARLGGNLKDGRISAALEMSQQLGVITLLKGHETVITDGSTVYINETGNPGMAVGGCGDVLSGMIVSLLGQGLPPLEAAACAAWLHGAAGDVCAKQIGQYGMLPSDMLNVLPRLMK